MFRGDTVESEVPVLTVLMDSTVVQIDNCTVVVVEVGLAIIMRVLPSRLEITLGFRK
jgi:hypothetical protein